MNTIQVCHRITPILTVITVCLNSGKTIEQTFRSVEAQVSPLLEYIVVDGNSTDETKEIIDRYGNLIDKLIMERDSGIYDAMNKAIGLATGDYVLNLNSDDYLEPNAIALVLNHLHRKNFPDHAILFGVTQTFGVKDSDSKFLKMRSCALQTRYTRNPFPHPSSVISRGIFSKVNGYDTDYNIAADYDFFLRALSLRPRLIYIDDVICNMRMGGISDEEQSFKILLKHSYELYQIQRKHIPKLGALYHFVARLFRTSAKRIKSRLSSQRFR